MSISEDVHDEWEIKNIIRKAKIGLLVFVVMIVVGFCVFIIC